METSDVALFKGEFDVTADLAQFRSTTGRGTETVQGITVGICFNINPWIDLFYSECDLGLFHSLRPGKE